MKIKKMDKKGFRYADIPMVFICFLIIGVGIAIGIYAFFSYSVDIRGLESKILAEKLLQGLLDNGKLKEEIFSDDFNIFSEAKVNKKIIDRNEHFFSIRIFKDSGQIKSFAGGNMEYNVLCELQGEKMPSCFSQKLFIDEYEIRILTASNYYGGSYE